MDTGSGLGAHHVSIAGTHFFVSVSARGRTVALLTTNVAVTRHNFAQEAFEHR